MRRRLRNPRRSTRLHEARQPASDQDRDSRLIADLTFVPVALDPFRRRPTAPRPLVHAVPRFQLGVVRAALLVAVVSHGDRGNDDGEQEAPESGPASPLGADHAELRTPSAAGLEGPAGSRRPSARRLHGARPCPRRATRRAAGSLPGWSNGPHSYARRLGLRGARRNRGDRARSTMARRLYRRLRRVFDRGFHARRDASRPPCARVGRFVWSGGLGLRLRGWLQRQLLLAHRSTSRRRDTRPRERTSKCRKLTAAALMPRVLNGSSQAPRGTCRYKATPWFWSHPAMACEPHAGRQGLLSPHRPWPVTGRALHPTARPVPFMKQAAEARASVDFPAGGSRAAASGRPGWTTVRRPLAGFLWSNGQAARRDGERPGRRIPL